MPPPSHAPPSAPSGPLWPATPNPAPPYLLQRGGRGGPRRRSSHAASWSWQHAQPSGARRGPVHVLLGWSFGNGRVVRAQPSLLPRPARPPLVPLVPFQISRGGGRLGTCGGELGILVGRGDSFLLRSGGLEPRWARAPPPLHADCVPSAAPPHFPPPPLPSYPPFQISDGPLSCLSRVGAWPPPAPPPPLQCRAWRRTPDGSHAGLAHSSASRRGGLAPPRPPPSPLQCFPYPAPGPPPHCPTLCVVHGWVGCG